MTEISAAGILRRLGVVELPIISTVNVPTLSSAPVDASLIGFENRRLFISPPDCCLRKVLGMSYNLT